MKFSVSTTQASGVLADRYARRVFFFSMLGRSTYGVLPLALILSVRSATDSLSMAGAAAAASAVGTFVMPWQARLIDAYDARRVLRPIAILFVLVVAILIVAVETPAWPPLGFVVLAVLLGPCSPALGPATRAFWRDGSTDDPRHKTASYGLDSAGEETLYLIGPLFCGAIVAGFSAAVALGVCALTLSVGVFGMTHSLPKTSAAKPVARPASFAWPDRMLLPILFLVTGLAGLLGATSFALVGFASALGHEGLAGVFEACLSLGSVAASLLYGRLAPLCGRLSQLMILAGLLTLGLSIAAIAESAGMFALGLVVAGAAIAPTMLIAYGLADGRIADEHAAEAGAWINVAFNLGIAAGSAAGGRGVAEAGPGPTLTALALIVLAAAAGLLATLLRKGGLSA